MKLKKIILAVGFYLFLSLTVNATETSIIDNNSMFIDPKLVNICTYPLFDVNLIPCLLDLKNNKETTIKDWKCELEMENYSIRTEKYLKEKRLQNFMHQDYE